MGEFLEGLKQKARQLQREALALWFALKDPRLPWYARLFSFYVVARTFSPIDLIPDFIPVLGYLDDLVLTPLGIYLALKMIPSEVMADARRQADQSLLKGKPARWWYAIPVVVIWLLALALAAAILLPLMKEK
jgi:uncharacterized membrane protein YkvA (DUF1232 family)